MSKREMWELQQMQSLPLHIKVQMTQYRIKEWVAEYGNDGVYVSFSGGKDSTVLLNIARELYPDIKAVFIDTGLEYPEIREFVKTFQNVEWLKPKKTFKQVVEEYGYPFVSKEVSGSVAETQKWLEKKGITFQNLLDRQTDRQTEVLTIAPYVADFIGIDRRGANKHSKEYKDLKMGIIPEIPIRTQQLMGVGKNPHNNELSPFNKIKWSFMVDSPYKFSSSCCSVMKKAPLHKYQKETGRNPMTAQMAAESRLRTAQWIKNGCNGFEMKTPISNPMAFWTEQDILHYIKQNNITICSVYGEILPEKAVWGDNGETQNTLFELYNDYNNVKLKTTGCNRTGCMFCGYGCHLEKEGEGRFERMKKTHPKQYDYIMRPKEKGGLNYKEVIDWINEHGNLKIRY